MSANRGWCRHYRGLKPDGAETCPVGVEFETILRRRGEGVERTVWACCYPDKVHCDKFEPYTDEEIAESDAAVKLAMDCMDAIGNGTGDTCPHCGERIEWLRQVSRSVYTSCGCRLWQGRIPAAWKDRTR